MQTTDIYPVSDFNRKPAEHIKRVRETRRPEVLTVNGKAAVVMMDPETYDKLTEQAELARSLDRIAQANAQFEQGDGRPITKVFDQLKQRLREKHPDADL
jgi:prevent-host-death family protein